MAGKRTYLIKGRDSLSEKEKKKADDFILKETSNGEFINTHLFLGYHTPGRFWDDSVTVWDADSGDVAGCMMAAQTEPGKAVSHPGTTFAGPVIDSRISIRLKEQILDIMLSYYEGKYRTVELHMAPGCYSFQPNDTLSYLLLRRGYVYGINALANIVRLPKQEKREDLLQMFHSVRRNEVKKTLKENQFCFQEEKEITSVLWNHMNQNIKAKFASKTTHTLDEIRDLKSRFPDKILPYSVYTHDGVYGAFALVFCFKNVFHTQYLDMNYELSGSYPNRYLIYRLMEEAYGMHYSFFSFGASTENAGKHLNYGLYNYKNEYGGGDMVLSVYTKTME